jgi:hypothetical protein
VATLPADMRNYPDAIAQAVSQLRLVGVNGPYSVSLSPANEPEPPLICAARNLKNSDDGQSAFETTSFCRGCRGQSFEQAPVLRSDTWYHTCPLGADIAAAARIPFPAHRRSAVAAHRRVAAETE